MIDWTIRELAMYDLPALVEHVCQETGYDKVSYYISTISRSLCKNQRLRAGGIHRSLSRKRTSIHLSVPRNVSLFGKETLSLYRPRSRRLCWTIDDRIPIYGAQQDRMEYLEALLWCTRFHTPHEVGL